MKERIEVLAFYGCGDEAYELFCAVCELVYKMNGLGQTGKAEILCCWAEELAEESKLWCLSEFESLDDVDQARGYYGYR